MYNHCLRVALTGVFMAGISPAVFAQGSLTPPGAPAPTMKTLSQVEPRIPISTVPTTISNSGSYYLTTNVTGATGISIGANSVTLDLNGFSLNGSGSGRGIYVTSPRTALVVFNGTVRGWEEGVNATNADYSRFEHLQIVNNSLIGLNTGSACTVSDCLAMTNAFAVGITVGDGCRVTGCIANGNFEGIVLGSNCTADSNNCRFNNGGGILTFGAGNRIEENHVSNNSNAGGIYAAGVSSTNNLIIRNLSRGNSQNYTVQPNNAMGPVINASGGLTLTTNNPWANFSF
jgi:parallel beta helix pectate lyase-like protein